MNKYSFVTDFYNNKNFSAFEKSLEANEKCNKNELDWLFIDACRDNNEILVDILINSNRIDFSFNEGLCFIEACREHNNDIVKKLFSIMPSIADLKYTDSFFWCVKDDNLEIFTFLLEENINHKAKEYSALKYMLLHNKEEFISSLLKSKNFFNIIDEDFFHGSEMFKFKKLYRLKNKFVSKKIEDF
jgi:hypothetical protein